ncbi:MAG: hypothetical protein JKY57_02705, partial [Kordiimonadaceae bacterium]|nr:hypothetical protein [Kordiimonadaceae bacterium]
MNNFTLSDARKNGWLARETPVPTAAPHNTKSTPPLSDLPLSGTTYFAKDLFDIKGEATPAGCAALQNQAPAAKDAAIIRQLNQLGAHLLGTSNMDALAYGFISNNPLYGLAKNPHDLTRICGGSSGGSAALVAAGLADFALGTDTSGSIRVPAAFTGIFGIKPTENKLSTDGAFPLSPTLDRVGLFAQTPSTLRRVFSALSPASKPASTTKATAPKLAILQGYFSRGLEHMVNTAITAFCFKNNIEDAVAIAGSAQARAAAYLLVAAEAAAVHANGLRATPALFDPETRARLLAAQAIPDAWVAAAKDEQKRYNAACQEAF